MVRHNNMIPNGHYHKKWQTHTRTWFDQPMKKVRRKFLRAKKLVNSVPKPIQLLRPTVSCPSVRYHSKLRKGRGFTLRELKQAGINKKYARTIGIAVDHRRRNRCVESVVRNVQRLKEYQERLILMPVKETQVVKLDSGKDLNKVKVRESKMKVRKVSEEEKKFEAYVTLRKARCDAKYAGVRIKRKLPKGENIDVSKSCN
ncbi:hypothetical protein Zmor_013560 [Zophobas morio]|uniref:60S ribosomal protein L13 n=1 Tax=Zophobas morio TaxID=2755281 RepID=A0AA38MFI7_9CUCU|nr:hypothetical protein Zmor_013560 [Zophobas morio]